MVRTVLLICFLSLTLSKASDQNEKRDSLVNFAKTHIGTPYKWGGKSTTGFDCSGFVYYVFKSFGLLLPRTSAGFENHTEEIPLTEAKPADLMLFTGTNSKEQKIGHIGIVVSNHNDTIDFIHSSSSKKHFGVCISRYNGGGYVKRFLKVIRIL